MSARFLLPRRRKTAIALPGWTLLSFRLLRTAAMRCHLCVPVQQLSSFLTGRNCGARVTGSTDRCHRSVSSNETVLVCMEKVKNVSIRARSRAAHRECAKGRQSGNRGVSAHERGDVFAITSVCQIHPKMHSAEGHWSGDWI